MRSLCFWWGRKASFTPWECTQSGLKFHFSKSLAMPPQIFSTRLRVVLDPEVERLICKPRPVQYRSIQAAADFISHGFHGRPRLCVWGGGVVDGIGVGWEQGVGV